MSQVPEAEAKDGDTKSGPGLTDFFKKIDKKIEEKREASNTQHSYDVPDLSREKEEKKTYYENRGESSWRERLDYMWRTDEYGGYSPELQFVKEGTLLSFLVGAGWGAWQETNKIHRIFLEQNKYTMFQHPREAQRALQDRIVLAMVQGGWRAGWRMGVLSFTMTSVCQSLTVIRNYINPLDYGLGGAAMGAVYRFHMGPRAMVGAGLGGAFLGLGAGVVVWSAQTLSGETVAERWNREFLLMEERKRVKEEIAANKDQRKYIVEEREREIKTSKTFHVEEDSQNTQEREDLVRDLVIKISGWLEAAGITRRSGGDNFKIVEESETERSERNVT